MTITIRDVARALNLSITTVSRALDGYDDVAKETRERVVQAAEEMGYFPSGAARQLRRQRADAIGFVIPTHVPRFADPFFSEFLAGLGDEVTSNNFDLLVSTAPPGDAAEKALYRRWVQSRRVDGLVLIRMRDPDWRVDYLSQGGIPFVGSGRSLSGIQHPFVEVDGQAGVAILVAHLAERGHRRIAYMGASPDLVLQAERYTGYLEGLAAAGLPLDPALVMTGDLTRTGGRKATSELLALPCPPTAVVCVNDVTAFGVMRAAHEHGLVVGVDLAVTGFDNLEDAEIVQPSLTTLNHPVYDIARQMVRMLRKQIQGEALEEPQVVLRPELIVRESSGGYNSP